MLEGEGGGNGGRPAVGVVAADNTLPVPVAADDRAVGELMGAGVPRTDVGGESVLPEYAVLLDRRLLRGSLRAPLLFDALLPLLAFRAGGVEWPEA